MILYLQIKQKENHQDIQAHGNREMSSELESLYGMVDGDSNEKENGKGKSK